LAPKAPKEIWDLLDLAALAALTAAQLALKELLVRLGRAVQEEYQDLKDLLVCPAQPVRQEVLLAHREKQARKVLRELLGQWLNLYFL
jgi:HEPN domain-containing protein